MKSIVKENKQKDTDETYLSNNYMKISVLLWGCNQQLIEKIEHLENSVYELQEEIKDLKKPKAKAKPNQKLKNKM